MKYSKINQSVLKTAVKLNVKCCSVLDHLPFVTIQIEKTDIKHERPYLTTFPNTEKGVENTTRSRVFLTNFRGCLQMWSNTGILCLIYLLSRN